MRINKAFNSFSAGQVSPHLFGRFDTKAFANGALEMTNMISDPRGPAIRRGGFSHFARINGKWDGVGNPADPGSWDDTQPVNNAVIHTFRKDTFNSRAVVIVEDALFVMSEANDELVAEDLANPGFTNGGAGWTVVTEHNSAEVIFADDRAYLEAGGNQANRYAMITQTISPSNRTGQYRLRLEGLFNGDGIASGVTVRCENGAGTPMTPEVTLSGGSRLHEVSVDLGPHNPATVVIEVEAFGTDSNGSFCDTVSFADIQVVPGDMQAFVSPWQEEDLHKIHTTMDFTGKNMYFVHPKHPPQFLKLANNGTWSFGAVVFTAPPAQWTGTNWPGTVTMAEGRSWWAATPDQPTTFWGSVSGSYEDFTGLGDSTASAALKFKLAQNGRIRWMGGLKNLIISTDLGEYIVTSNGGVIVPNDILVQKQSSFGSNAVQAQQLGNEMVFISPDHRRVRTMRYQWVEDGFLSRDLTYIADNITEGHAVSCTVIQNPNTDLFFATAAGEILGCSYHKDDGETPTYGWYRVVTNGFFRDTTDIHVDGVLEVWAVTLRNVSGKNEIHVERLNTGDIVYLDAYIRLEDASLTDTVTGLDHLEGYTVQPVVDGAVEPTKVVTGGQITLENEGQMIEVGLNYTSKLVTLPVIMQTQGGVNAPDFKRWSRLWVRVFDSAKPIINGDRPATRYAETPMNIRQGDKTEDVEVTDVGYRRLGEVTVEQDLPLPLWVNMVHGWIETNDLR